LRRGFAVIRLRQVGSLRDPTSSAVWTVCSADRPGGQAHILGGLSMRFADVIARKRDGQPLTRDEIALFVRGVVDGSVPDYQAAALLMAIVLRGMNGEETWFLTDEM